MKIYKLICIGQLTCFFLSFVIVPAKAESIYKDDSTILYKSFNMSEPIEKKDVSSIIYDDFGEEISEEEIKNISKPQDYFAYSLSTGLVGGMIGGSIGSLSAVLSNDMSTLKGAMSFFGQTAVGGLVGFLGGIAYSGIYPPQPMERSKAIKQIKDQQIRNWREKHEKEQYQSK